jgi:hypothetical protein
VRRGGLDFGTDHRRRYCHFAAEQLSEAFCYRRHGERWRWLASGTPKVRCQDDRGLAVEEIPDGGQGGANARVVGNFAIAEGYIEVNAHQHALAPHIRVGDRSPGH